MMANKLTKEMFQDVIAFFVSDGILYEIRRVFSGKLPVGRNPVSEGERIFSSIAGLLLEWTDENRQSFSVHNCNW